MRKSNYNLRLLTVIFVVSLIISNVVTGKLVATGLHFNNTQMVLPGAMFCYALTFLMTDVIGEIWGKQQANECVKLGFIAQLTALVLIQLTKYLPAYDFPMQEAYNLVLGQGWLYVLASLLAYYTAQTWDVWIFHKIRNYFNGKAQYKYVWNNISTITSQFIDTMIFITVAFGIGYGWLFTDVKMLGLMIVGQYLFKAGLAILDTPLFYILTRKKECVL
jgi:uncharacterized integral membrane protein (TIGR00697 family)